MVHDVDIKEETSHALHQENGWYLIPRRYCRLLADYTATPKMDSMLFHVCSESKYAADHKWTSHWYATSHMGMCCPECGHLPPKGLQGLWLLHNWDHLNDA